MPQSLLTRVNSDMVFDGLMVSTPPVFFHPPPIHPLPGQSVACVVSMDLSSPPLSENTISVYDSREYSQL
jgi:hypothetical protein